MKKELIAHLKELVEETGESLMLQPVDDSGFEIYYGFRKIEKITEGDYEDPIGFLLALNDFFAMNNSQALLYDGKRMKTINGCNGGR